MLQMVLLIYFWIHSFASCTIHGGTDREQNIVQFISLIMLLKFKIVGLM